MNKTFNNRYIKSASSEVPLFYPRHQMTNGQKIEGNYIPNEKLISTLAKCESIYIYFYLKLLGDSLLFLSTVQATLDYLSLSRKDNLPRLYAQSELKSLLQHCSLFKNAIYIDNLEENFIKASKDTIVGMITDGDPFEYASSSYVFNTEDYIYPKFTEVNSSNVVEEYRSRPARYYLTFEREVGVKLFGDPNKAIPFFEFSKSKEIEKRLKNNIGLSLNEFDTYVSLITFVNSKERQKQFGVVRYLEVAAKIQRKAGKKICFVLLIHKSEESKCWNEVVQYIHDHRDLNVCIYDGDDLEEMGYVLSRMDLHIGNDTGMSHLASIVMDSKKVSLVPTIITYSRHDYGKWSTGVDSVYPVYTKLAKYLTDTNK